MAPKEFLITKMKELVHSFPHVRVRYAYDEFSYTHTIEITPQSQYDKDELLNWRCDILVEFISKYPAEALNFISEEYIDGIERPELEMRGELNMSNKYTVSNLETISILPILQQGNPLSVIGFASFNYEESSFNVKPYAVTDNSHADAPLAA